MTLRNKIKYLKQRISLNKKTFILYSVLRALVILTAIRCLIQENYESFMLCILSLLLFLMPSLLEVKLKLRFPPLFEAFIYLFIYAAEILGEINHYYTIIPGWDTMLHTINGFLCAAIGFSLIEILNRNSNHITLSPFYLALVGFCFSMTIGVLWEFFEYSFDHFFFLDMQKDFIVKNIGTITLDPTGSQTPVVIHDITDTVIHTADGKTYTIDGGYLDIGINDTMKDLIVNFIGAITFSILSYIYEKTRDLKERNRAAEIAGSLMLTSLTDEDLARQASQIEEQQAAIAEERRKRRKLLRHGKKKENS